MLSSSLLTLWKTPHLNPQCRHELITAQLLRRLRVLAALFGHLWLWDLPSPITVSCFFQGNAVYNIMPDMVSRLSDAEVGVKEEPFRTIMKWVGNLFKNWNSRVTRNGPTPHLPTAANIPWLCFYILQVFVLFHPKGQAVWKSGGKIVPQI